MRELAKGGFQVGALAQKYDELFFSNVVSLAGEKDPKQAAQLTEELMQQENVVIFEPAFAYEGCLVRVDILRKFGGVVQLLEVKAKTFDSTEGSATFWNVAQDALLMKWAPYLYDVAFQVWVLQKVHPKLAVHPFLLLPDKSKRSSVAGLNQLFRAKNEGTAARPVWKVISPPDLTRERLGNSILSEQPVTKEVEFIFQHNNHRPRTFEDEIRGWGAASSEMQAEEWPCNRSTACRSCEFRKVPEGFTRCFAEGGLSEKDRLGPFVFDVWNIRPRKMWDNGIVLMKDITPDMLITKKRKPKFPESEPTPQEPGLTTQQRQLLQVSKYQKGDTSSYFDKEGFLGELAKVRYPIHFIDFETTRTALPFFSNRAPYDQIAFQFSHHQMEEDGSISHKAQFLGTVEDPTLDFLENLRATLNKDNGTVLRYASHENSVLVDLLARYPTHPKLFEFFETLTRTKEHEGSRAMVDLLNLVKKFYYNPSTRGSNSLKAVLPAILKESKLLQDKYSQPIYGKSIPSLNFAPIAWVQKDANGEVKDPYKLLPKLPEIDDFEDDELAHGGAAMTAWGAMQYVDMSDESQRELQKALLRYCELDTFAMCLLWEHLCHLAK